jgi:hypothetical protein
MPKPSSIVNPIHFEDYDPRDFERLVFAFLLRTERWQTLEWYGQVGADLGRDVWGVRDSDEQQKRTVCIQCANRRRVPLKKVLQDIDRVIAAPNGTPSEFLLIAGGAVSSRLRDAIKKYATQKQILACAVWSGPEFEERLRNNAESLLKRFAHGETFPDTVPEIRKLVESVSVAKDEEILVLMASLFDRPAFYTPFHQESSIPAFKKAITDTIEAFSTGVHRLRDGTEIRRMPSRHDLKSAGLRTSLSEIERMLCALRVKYDELLKSGDLRPCGCNDPNCPVFMVSPMAAREMDKLRTSILDAFRKIYPPFGVHLGWHFHD